MSSFPGLFFQFFDIEKSEIFFLNRKKNPPFFIRICRKKIHRSFPLGQIDDLSTHLNHFVIKLCKKPMEWFFFRCDRFPQE